MLQPSVLRNVGSYLVEHPDELVRILRNAAALRFGVPLAALRWFAARASGRHAPQDIRIETVPPGIRLGATLRIMGATVRTSALVFVDGVRLGRSELRLELRFSEVELELLDHAKSPLSSLLRSGALDLTKLGNLVAVMPRRPAFVVEAEGDRIVIDLKRHPAFQGARTETLLALITPLVTITGVATDHEHVDVELGVLEQGVAAAVASWRSILGNAR
jgi:hypothetical protein